MREVLFAAAVLVFLLFAGDTARACDCVTLLPDKSFENADLVFEGQLNGVHRLEADGPYRFAYVFKIDKTLKGPTFRTVALGGNDSDCDAHFQTNVIYRVYASSQNGTLVSGGCSGNQVIGVLRVITPHLTNELASFWQRRFIDLLAVCGVGVLLGSTVFVWRRYIKKLP